MGQVADAERQYQAGSVLTMNVSLAGWNARVNTLGGLVAWVRGDVALAETMLREATVESPKDELPHAYLAQLLETKGQTAAAAAERAAADNVRPFDFEVIAQVQSLFWLDPVHGGMRRRM